MSTFKKDDIVQRKGADTTGVVLRTWTDRNIEKVLVQTSPMIPAITFKASELKLYELSSPDVVLISYEGETYGLEVAGLNVDGTAFHFSSDGKMWELPVSRIVKVIPVKTPISYATLYEVMEA